MRARTDRCIGIGVRHGILSLAITVSGSGLLSTAVASELPISTSHAKHSKSLQLASTANAGGVTWVSWSDDIFERAKKDDKLVILDLEAVWCHWCHVMDAETYSNGAVQKILKSNYICVKVDQDSRPDLSNKYEQYGWPATIIFAPDGTELSKRSGFIRPEEMATLLKTLNKTRKPEDDVATAKQIKYVEGASLPEDLRKEMEKKHVDGYDTENGAWGFQQKFLDWDSVEYAMERAAEGDKDSEKRARDTLKAQMNLIDPVWGGVYQYSTHGDWKHAHFEKIMQMQAENLKVYAQGYMLFKDESYLKAAKDIEGYLSAFLTSPDGAFYTSQDADLVPGQHSSEYFDLSDSERRKQGIPRVDQHVYARENGWAINALVYLYMVTDDDKYLKKATKAAEYILKNRAIAGGGFTHDQKDNGGPFLGDTLAMGRAFLTLYVATADKAWLEKAQSAADFIGKHFSHATADGAGAGFVTSEPSPTNAIKPEPLLEENIMLARFANMLYQYTGKADYKKMSEQTMRYLATPEIARKRKILVAGTLLADREIANAPAHITILGSKKDAQARELFEAALKTPSVYKRIDWWDREEGKPANLDVDFPELKTAAAFVCAGGRCSAPAYKPDAIAAILARFTTNN